jgi:hypothetical protein
MILKVGTVEQLRNVPMPSIPVPTVQIFEILLKTFNIHDSLIKLRA